MTDLPIAGKLVPLLQTGVVADAADIATTGGSNVQTDINNLDAAILHWRFNASVTDATNPGATFLALNNAVKDNVTIVSFNTTSNIDSARFDELLTSLRADDYIFLQQRDAINTSILFRVTGFPTIDGTKVNVPVARMRDQGPDTFTADSDLNVIIWKGGGDSVRSLRTINSTDSPLVQVNAASPSTFATSLSGLTIVANNAFRVNSPGEPFAGVTIEAAIGDVLVATVDSPSLTNVQHWAMIPRADILVDIKRSVSTGSVDISSLESKVNALFPLTPQVSKLVDLGTIYVPNQAVQVVQETAGYSNFIDYRSDSDRYESTGITYDNSGANVVDYTGLASDFHQILGFTVSGPSDKVLLWAVVGAEVIPLIDTTAGGSIRVNNFTPATTQDQVVTGRSNLVTSPTSGTGTLTVGGPVSTYTATPYPANTTNQSRTISVDLNVALNGSDTLNGGFVNFDIPDDLTAQAKQTVTHSFYLGFPYNRGVNATVGLTVRVSGADLLLDLSLESISDSTATLIVQEVDVQQNYTQQVAVARVDNFVAATLDNQPYTFSNAHEFIFAVHPIVPNNGRADFVPAAIEISTGTISLLDDPVATDPPDMSHLRIPDDIEFRAFLPDHYLIHNDLRALLQNRTQRFAYGLALQRTVSEHAFSQPIDLAAGSKLGGTALQISGNSIEHESVNLTTGAGGLISSFNLPENYTNFQYVYLDIFISNVWYPIEVSTRLLSQTLFAGGHSIDINGTRSLNWTVGTRTLAIDDNSQIIALVALKRLQ